MIVRNLDVERIAIDPVKADPPLLVDPDAVLPLAITAKLFEPIAWVGQIAQFFGAPKKSQLAECRTLDILRKPRRSDAIEDAFGVGISKAANHLVLSVLHTIRTVKQRYRDEVNAMITERELRRDEIPLIWSIDRSEVIENIYHLENGVLVLRPHHVEVPGWPPGEAERYTPDPPRMLRSRRMVPRRIRGRSLVAASSSWTAGASARIRISSSSSFCMWTVRIAISGWRRACSASRGRPRARGAPAGCTSRRRRSENTVKFYLRLGCEVARDPDAELFALEPEDIHLECAV